MTFDDPSVTSRRFGRDHPYPRKDRDICVNYLMKYTQSSARLNKSVRFVCGEKLEWERPHLLDAKQKISLKIKHTWSARILLNKWICFVLFPIGLLFLVFPIELKYNLSS